MAESLDLENESRDGSQDISRRAARRIIQRAIVLVGRNRALRQQIREIHLTILCRIEDWNFSWTLSLDRGKVHFDRRPARRPDVNVTWSSASIFFDQIARPDPHSPGYEIEHGEESRHLWRMIYEAFRKEMANVIEYPFDEAGNRIA